MKKSILFIGALMLLISSCTKDYSCSCTDTDIYDGMTETTTYTYSIKEASKKEAQGACIEATVTHLGEDGDSYATKCNLSK